MISHINNIIKKIYRLFRKFSLRSIIKTAIFNFVYFDFKDALKFPVHVYRTVELRHLGGEIIVNSPLRYGMITLGFTGWTEFPKKSTFSVWNVRGRVVFEKDATFGHGFVVDVGNNAELSFGEGFILSGSSVIRCYKHISIGKVCAISWECLLMDTDFHPVMDIASKRIINSDRDIIIGNHVMIGCRVTLLKGTKVGNMCVIAANSLLNREIVGCNIIIGGNPSRVLKENIIWADNIDCLKEEYDL